MSRPGARVGRRDPRWVNPAGFGHPPATLVFWTNLVKRALRSHPTPFYLCSIEPIRAALAELDTLSAGLPLRHWLSCKTQPIRPLLQWWRREGLGIEVVSQYELLAARAEGFPADRILVNGPAKQTWLPQCAVRGLGVNFDSLIEAKALLPLAKRLNWRVGVRCHTQAEFDPQNPSWPTQFGMARDEAVAALKLLQRAQVRTEIVHFHLRTNVTSPAHYERALREVIALCRAARFAPLYLDCGGGLPPHHVLSKDGAAYDARFDLAELARVYQRATRALPGLRELWLENGRFLSARSGVLVIRVLEVKERKGCRQLLCDGGRTTHALISNWEDHGLYALPARTGRMTPTAVCGATCMAFDQIARRPLPRGLRGGDCLVWMDAGAYHIPWETRFSHGYAKVLWHEDGQIHVARERESFSNWWGQWE